MPTPNWSALDTFLGEVDILAIDQSGPGPYALVGPNAGKAGRNSFYAEILRAWDPTLGAGEFQYMQAAISVAPGQVCQFAYSQDANNAMVLQATPWTGVAYTGSPLAVAVSPVGTGQWGWFQIGGFGIALFGGTTAGATISSITISGNIATVTTSTAHGLTAGQSIVTLTGQTSALYAGSYTIATTPTATTFTYLVPSNNAPTATATVVGSYIVYSGVVAGGTVASATTTTATVGQITTSASHGLEVGSVISTVSFTPGAYNVTGVAVASVGSNTTFTIPLASAPGSTASAVGSYNVVGGAAGALAYFSATGSVASISVAGKLMEQTQFALSTAALLSTGTGALQLPATKCVLFLARPATEGGIT